MFFGPKTLPLDIADTNTRIHVELQRYEIVAINDYEKEIQFQYRKNIVLTYYNYDDSNGNWGTVDEHYVSTDDLLQISNGFQRLLSHQLELFEYQTVIDEMGNPFMMLSCTRSNNGFSIKIQLSEGLFQEWLSVVLSDLTLEQFNEYAQVFIRWAKDYPVLSEKDLLIAKEIPFK